MAHVNCLSRCMFFPLIISRVIFQWSLCKCGYEVFALAFLKFVYLRGFDTKLSPII